MAVTYDWRGRFSNAEANELHAEAFETRVFDETEWNWVDLVHRHSLGWMTARNGGRLVGFVNAVSDRPSHARLQRTSAALVRAWLQDLVGPAARRHEGIARRVVEVATEQARAAGCDWLHVDFDE